MLNIDFCRIIDAAFNFSCELPRLIEVGASCFFDSGYCHTANWQFSQNLRKRLRSARSRPTILLFFMLPVSVYLRF